MKWKGKQTMILRIFCQIIFVLVLISSCATSNKKKIALSCGKDSLKVDSAFACKEKSTLVKKSGQWYFLQCRDGRPVDRYQKKFDDVRIGLATGCFDDQMFILVKYRGKWGYINITGKWLQKFYLAQFIEVCKHIRSDGLG
jgi:hypothetical protein